MGSSLLLLGLLRRQSQKKVQRKAASCQVLPSTLPERLPESLSGALSCASMALTGTSHAEMPKNQTQSLTARRLLMPKTFPKGKPNKPLIKPFNHSTKWKFRGNSPSTNRPVYGKYALQCLQEGWISNKTIEAVRRTLVQVMERKGKVWLRGFPDTAITKRTQDSRMGAGKGAINTFVQVVRPGFILFEIDGVEEIVARNAFRKADHKIPVTTKFLRKMDGPSLFELGRAGMTAEQKRKLSAAQYQAQFGAPGGAK